MGSRQHIHASAFHLREFKGDDGRVARVTTSGRISHHHPTAVCYVPDALTDSDVPEDQRFWLEDELRDYETKIAPVVKRTLDAARSRAHPSDTDEAFTMYLALQYGRSMHQGDWIQNIDATASVARARSDLMPRQYAELIREFPYPALFTTEYGLAHPELPFVPMPDKQGVMVAMAPSALFVRTKSEFNPDNAHWFYW